MSDERYWFNIVTEQVETDADAGRRRDRLGPYPSREAAAGALRTAQARNEVWESPLRDRPRPDGWPALPRPRLTRLDRFVLRHRRGVRAALVVIAVVAAADAVRLFTLGDNGLLLALVAWQAVWTAFGPLPQLVRRQRALERLSGGASGAPPGRTPR